MAVEFVIVAYFMTAFRSMITVRYGVNVVSKLRGMIIIYCNVMNYG